MARANRTTQEDLAPITNLEGQLDALDEIADDEESVEVPSEGEWDALTEPQKKSRLRSQAQQIVMNNHRDEFNLVADRLFKERGLEFKRKLTARERAAEQVRQLIAEHNLRAEFPGVYAEAEQAAPPEGTKVG